MAYPQAQLWGSRLTIIKCRELEFREPLEDLSPAEWGCIEQTWFKGSCAMDKVVVFHRPSRTVILVDLIEALTEPFLQERWTWRGCLLASGWHRRR